MRREKISCRAFRRGKNILPTTRLLEKKIADQKSPRNHPSFVEANHSTVTSKDSLYFHTSSSPVEANNSKLVQFVVDNSTVKSCSLSVSVSVEAKEMKTCRSLVVEENYANEDI